MTDPVLTVQCERGDDGRFRVLSPGVGWWFEIPPSGMVVGPGSSVGRLRRLNRSFLLVLPQGFAGRVELEGTGHVRPVAFGDALFDILSIESGEHLGVSTRVGHATDGDLPAGAHAVTAPTDGVFYCRPSPDSAPFVEVGSRVSRGQPVGLVEVMKTFNQITYGGPGLPDEAEVLEVRCEDGAEISSGDPLVVVR